MPFFDTKTPQYNLGGLTNLVAQASQSPLKSLGNTMTQLDSIVQQRAKEQYSRGVQEQLAGAETPQQYADIVKGMDVTMATPELTTLTKTMLPQLAGLQQEARLQRAQDLQFGTPQQRLEAQTTLGNALGLAPDQYDEVSELEALKANNIDNPVMVSALDQMIQGKVETQLGGGSMNAYEQKIAAVKAQKEAESVYEKDPTPENYRAMLDAQDIAITMTKGGPEAVREIKDAEIVRRSTTAGKTLIDEPENATKYPDATRYMLEDRFRNTKSSKGLERDEQKFMDSTGSVKALTRLESLLNGAIQRGEFDTGLMGNMQQMMGEMTPDDWRALSGKSTREIMVQAGLEGQIGTEVAEILREMSGLAATDGEFRRTLINTVGGNWAQEDVKLERLRSFINTRNKRAIELGERLVKSGLVGRTYDQLQELGVLTAPKPVAQPDTAVQAQAPTPRQQFAPGQRAVQNGVTYEFNGTDWLPVAGGR